MKWIAAWRERVRALLFGAWQDTEMDEELRFHLDKETELLREARMTLRSSHSERRRDPDPGVR